MQHANMQYEHSCYIYPMQTKTWSGNFGQEYTDRNLLTLADMEKLYLRNFGKTRTEMNEEILHDIQKDIRVLEVGCNVGIQLLCLQNIGFKNLYGIELQPYAVELSKSRTKSINIIQGSAFDIPFKDAYFDLVFTSGLLIHISPNHIQAVLEEIHRCTSRYIWGFEYYSDEYTEIEYRGKKNLLWKTNFAQLFLDNFADLHLIRREKYKYIGNDNTDEMYLLGT